jgi:uncharacterized protein involved in cysteine biosynthesis
MDVGDLKETIEAYSNKTIWDVTIVITVIVMIYLTFTVDYTSFNFTSQVILILSDVHQWKCKGMPQYCHLLGNIQWLFNTTHLKVINR